MKKDFTLITNKSEIGAGTRGASVGVEALILTAIAKGSTLFSNAPQIKIKHNNHLLAKPIVHQQAKHIDAIIPVYQDLCDKVSNVLQNKQFPLIVSGDHASAGGTIAGIKKAYPNKKLGIIWIDAHADLHSPYTSPSGNVHGMPLAATLNKDNLSFDSGRVSAETKQCWEQLKSIGGICPKANPEDLVFIGVRDTEKEEDHLIKENNIANFTTEYLRAHGAAKVVSEIKENNLKHCDIVYVSFDVDSLDCDAVSYGTGTPVKNGLFVEEAKEILRALVNWDKIVALEVTEINPLLDNKINTMAETALEILEHALVVKN